MVLGGCLRFFECLPCRSLLGEGTTIWEASDRSLFFWAFSQADELFQNVLIEKTGFFEVCWDAKGYFFEESRVCDGDFFPRINI